MENLNGVPCFYAKNRAAWRKWLKIHHVKETAVWLIMYKINASIKGVTYEEAVEEALCFGWIDSKKISKDAESFMQYFSKRKAKSNWSKSNKDRVESLIQQGLMTPAGMATIQIAKENGSWELLDDVENLVVPQDLKKAMSHYKSALHNWEKFSKSSKLLMLMWIKSAKTTATRDKRILQTASLAEKNMKAR